MKMLKNIGSLARAPGGSARLSSGGDGASPESSAASSKVLEEQLARLRVADENRKSRETRLSQLKPVLMDNTLVECLSTGSETVEDKVAIFKLLKQCGLRSIVLAAFVRGRPADLATLSALRSAGLIDQHCAAFSELFDANGSDLPGQDLPYGLAKMIQFGIQNAILECDLAASYINWDKCSPEDFCALVESRCRWVAANLYAGRAQAPASFVSIRDFAPAMQAAPARVLRLVDFLGRLAPGVRPRGIIINEPAAGHLPQDAGAAVSAVRAVMDAAGWADGTLSVHVGAGNGLAHATVLECLASGCDGALACLCEEAEPTSPRASSLIDLLNLAALGNSHVAATYDAAQLRAAARQVTAVAHRAAAAAAVAAADAAAKEAEEEDAPVKPYAAPAPRSPATSGGGAGPGAAHQPGRQPLIHGHA